MRKRKTGRHTERQTDRQTDMYLIVIDVDAYFFLFEMEGEFAVIQST